MPNNSLSYPKVCKRKDGKYYIDFKLNNVRYRLFSGRLIGSSLYPNSYPSKKRFSMTSALAKQVYEFIVSNNYALTKPLSPVELYDNLINDKLAQPLSISYKKTLEYLSALLREELIKKGRISSVFIDSIPLRYNNNTSYNTTRRHLNVLVNYLHSRDFPIELSKLKTRNQEEVLHMAASSRRPSIPGISGPAKLIFFGNRPVRPRAFLALTVISTAASWKVLPTPSLMTGRSAVPMLPTVLPRSGPCWPSRSRRRAAGP